MTRTPLDHDAASEPGRREPAWRAGPSLALVAAAGAVVAGLATLAIGQEEPTALPTGPARMEDSSWLVERLRAACAPSADEALQARLAPLLERPAEFRLQVLVSKVVAGDVPRLERHGFRVDAEYVYPASAIKTCAAVAAVAALEEFGLPLDAALVFHPLFDDELLEREDPSNANGGAITVQHELRKLFLVSDNRAYNRLYELVGHREINERMWAAGLTSTRIQHRLSEFRSPADQRRTPRVELLVQGQTQREVPARDSDLVFDNGDLQGLALGTAHLDANEVLVAEPLSFLQKNWISLVDLQDLVVLLVRPDIDVGAPGFGLSPSGRSALVGAMGEYAPESSNPRYDAAEYPRTFGKFLLTGIERVLPSERLRLANKVGRAYGFSVENAYVEDRATGRAFFVTAVLFTNADGVMNDGVYEYASIADPFLTELGAELARELLAP